MRLTALIGTLAVLLVASACEDGTAPTDTEANTRTEASTEAADRSRGHRGPPEHAGAAVFEFEEMVGNSRPIVGDAVPIRGVNAGGLPWVVDDAEARLDGDGGFRAEVEGLVLDPDDEQVQEAGLAGQNPVADFRAIVSCLTISDSDVSPANVQTSTAPATPDGDWRIEETLTGLPDPCLAPIVFVTSPGGAWFAVSGF